MSRLREFVTFSLRPHVLFSLRDVRQGCISVSFFFMERNCATTLATGCSFLVEIVFHVLQIMLLSPRSPDIEQSFRGQLMEVRSVLARCMKRESVTHYQCVQCIGKNIIYDQPYVIFLSSREHVLEFYCICFHCQCCMQALLKSLNIIKIIMSLPF